MTLETKANEMIHPGDPVTEAQERAIKYWRSAHHFRRRTLEEAWKCGQALAVVKNELSRGEWMPWLYKVGITHDTARRWIRLSAHYQSPQLADFGSVDQALRAMPPARPKREKALEPGNDESAETENHPVDNAHVALETEDLHPAADDEESNNAPAASEPDATASRNGDHPDGDELAILLGEAPRQVGTDSPQGPVDQLPQVQGQDRSPGPEKEVADGGGTPPLPGLLEDAHREILQLRRKLHKSERKLQKARDQRAELQQEIDRLKRRLEHSPKTGFH